MIYIRIHDEQQCLFNFQEYRYCYKYHFKIQKKKLFMNHYFTPLKEQLSNQSRTSKTASQQREGDWVCYNCNNLNFSFRKKCNRCKIQTRQHNQHMESMYYQYYPNCQYYPQNQNKENFPLVFHNPIPQAETHQLESPFQENIINSPQTQLKHPKTPEKMVRDRELPSVSPLVKRYNRNECSSTGQSKQKGLYMNDSLWDNINLKYLDQNNEDDEQEDNQQLQQIQKIIQDIIL